MTADDVENKELTSALSAVIAGCCVLSHLRFAYRRYSAESTFCAKPCCSHKMVVSNKATPLSIPLRSATEHARLFAGASDGWWCTRVTAASSRFIKGVRTSVCYADERLQTEGV